MKRKLLPLVLAVAWGISGISWAQGEKIGMAVSDEGKHISFGAEVAKG